MQTRGPWILLPENRAARQAVERVRDCVCGRGPRRLINPLLLHGPPGTGKSHLVNDLVVEVTRRLPQGLVVGLEAFGVASRQEYLRRRLAERGLDLPGELLAWLARTASGSARQLDGCLTRLEVLAATLGRPVRFDDLADLFGDD